MREENIFVILHWSLKEFLNGKVKTLDEKLQDINFPRVTKEDLNFNRKTFTSPRKTILREESEKLSNANLSN